MTDRELTEIEVDWIKAETDAAFLCVVNGDDHWIPKSQIESPEDYGRFDEGITMLITLWIADQKGLS